jgi:thymidylate kinase
VLTIALIGPDGAGKTTVARMLEAELQPSVKYLYMGVSTDSSNHMLPTTRLMQAVKRARGEAPDNRGPRDRDEVLAPRPAGGMPKRALRSGKAALRTTNRLAEEWYRQYLAWSYGRHGVIVIFDRHFFADYHAYDIAGGPGLPLSRRIHGFLLEKAYPKPDLVVYLDAPAGVLLARKGEGSLELLERRRSDYLGLADIAPDFVVVDATLPVGDVADRVVELIRERIRVPTE